MDNYPTYELLNHYDIIPFIALDTRTKAKFSYPHPHILCFDENGRPICFGGIPYHNWGYSKRYQVLMLVYCSWSETASRM
jgi:hypothetical protein